MQDNKKQLVIKGGGRAPCNEKLRIWFKRIKEEGEQWNQQYRDYGDWTAGCGEHARLGRALGWVFQFYNAKYESLNE